jgi:hypothetical protein
VPNSARLTLGDIEATKESFPAEVLSNPSKTKWYLATTLIKHFLGDSWVQEHMAWDPANPGPGTGFFRVDFSSDEARERKTARILDFAETLFNLQHVEGFDDRVEYMRTNDPEATFAEFDFGRLLYVHDVDFEFVKPQFVAGQDYDYRIRYADGRTACADAKCRLESGDMLPKAVRNALEKARSQNLPKDAPGIIFVKLPESWLRNEVARQGLLDVAREFLRRTERVVSIVLYVSLFIVGPNQLRQRHLLEEMENAKHRFDQTKSWIVFKPRELPANWTGMPPKWVRVFTLGPSEK